MNDECIFCKIINGDFGTEFVYENEHLSAMQDTDYIHTFSVFSSEAFYKEMQSLSLKAALGDADAAEKIKNMLLSS